MTETNVPEQVRVWLENLHQAVLVTIRADGSPQSSNIAFDLNAEVARISVTVDRAKTRNLGRDPRAVLHVLGDTFWQFASIVVDAELSPVTTEPGDAAGRELLEVYEGITGASHRPAGVLRGDGRRAATGLAPATALCGVARST